MSNNERNTTAESVVAKLLSESSGFDLNELDRHASFPELGFDSLFLVQFSQKIKGKANVKVTFRQLIEELTNIDALISYIAEQLPEDIVAASQTTSQPIPQPVASEPTHVDTNAPVAQIQAQPAITAPPTRPNVQAAPPIEAPPKPVVLPPLTTASSGTDKAQLAEIISQQNQLMSLQLQLLTGAGAPVATQAVETPAQPATEVQDPAVSESSAGIRTSSEPSTAEQPKVEKPVTAPTIEAGPPAKKSFERFGPYKPVRRAADGGLTEQQQKSLDTFIARFTKRTARSRQHAQLHRSHFADPRGVAGYRRIWKSMVYQIAVERSKGSKLWDLDGNEYIDIAMGFGLNLFGQSPDFVNDAVANQLKLGVEVGPQSPLAGEVAQLLCDFSRKDRATFCNTGSEAVMAAMRLARTVTGKSKIVYFNKDYHGNFDQVLIRSTCIGNRLRSQPAAPGVPQSFADETIVLDYGTDQALETIRQRADEIAAVLVEPVQSADPFMQPREFLHEIRRITKENQIAMVMDEVITGFRAAQGGAQQWFDVWGDMATYGKVLGGGLPIGALTGSAEYMDALDGGDWKYEDDSEPEADMTFFAGTFVRHPLAMAAAYQVLMKVKESGPELQEELTRKTTYLVDSLNEFFEKELYPFRLAQFSSLFRFMFPPAVEYADLLYFHLLDRGIFTRGWADNCFLSTAHSDADVERIIESVKDSCEEIRRGGFLPKASELSDDVATAGTSGAAKKKARRFQLTEAQLEIWVTSQMSDDASCSYNEPFTVRFRGNLNADYLCDALQAVVARHKSLHLHFDESGQHQELCDARPVEIDRVDLRSLPPHEREAALAETASQIGSMPFDLSTGPLIRLKLLRVSDEDHVLIFSAHHIVSDGWSTNLMLGEVCEIYTARTEQREPDLDEPGDIRDYVAMEMEQGEDSDALDFWLKEYQDVPDPLELPYDRPRPAVKSYAGSTYIHKFRPETYQAITSTAAQEKATLFSITFSALNVLLARLSGQDDIVVAIPTAGQLNADNQCLVGHCVNLLPIRSRLNLDDSFTVLAKDSQSRVLDAFDHQQCTLGRIIRELQIPRDPSRMPLVEVNFNLDRDGAGLDFPGLELEIAQTIKTASTFDLFFNLNETEQGLELYLDYSTALFDEATVRRWAGHYETLLQAIADSPERAIGELSLLTEREQQQILTDWNATQQDYPASTSVHELFEQQVQSVPDAIAVVSGNARFTYRDINQQANRLARYLQSFGVAREQLVGIHLDRTEQMVVAVLAVLKAGACYVPLDPKFPAGRLAMMAKDAELSVIVTQQSLLAGQFANDAQKICVDRDAALIGQCDASDLGLDADPRQLAYVLYTSGSTGRPKGVQIPHQALTNFLCSMQQAPGLNADDVLLGVTTLSFDISALEIYLPLITGACVVIVPADETSDADALQKQIQKSKVTVMQATPATWRLLVDSGWSGNPGMKILCGGEALPQDLARELLNRGESLWNLYGPTETTIWSTISQIQSAHDVTIGRPIANTEIYILDQRGRPVPPGVPGRLFIGGDGLARGYHQRPELTEQKFVPHPFSTSPGELIYDTGDQARYRANSELEFIGRLDNQVKIRGFRIELDEIEQALAKHPAIEQAVAVVRDDVTDGEKSIVGYLMTGRQPTPSTTELREHLRETLPEYMIPSAFVSLDDFPLTPNRKVDRSALPAPTMVHRETTSTLAAPADSIELQIVNLWKKTLKLPTVGLDDNFFDMGGHSLLAARMIVDIEKIFGHRLPLATLLQAPTARQFSELIRKKKWKPAWHCLVPIQEGGASLPLFCVHAAGGNVLLYRDLAKHLGPDQPVYGLQAKGLDGQQPVHTTVQQMAAEYVNEIRKIQPQGPYHLGGYCLGGTIAYEVAQQLVAGGEEVAVLALFDTHSKWFQASAMARTYGVYQQFAFHAGNAFKSGAKGIGSFMKEKLSELNRRIGRRLAVEGSRLAYHLGLRKEKPLVMLEHINDRASEEYVPEYYPGKVTVFKPCKSYRGYEDPTLGWGDGLVNEIDVVELPVFPAGMLIEPFVERTARHLQQRLSDQTHRTDAAEHQPRISESNLEDVAV